VFVISAAFPLAAGLAKDTSRFPTWWGTLDVSVAFLLAVLAMAVLASTSGRVTRRSEELAYRGYRVLTHGLFAVLVVFVLFGDRIVWAQCLPGFAWRTWLLLYTLPAWFTALGTAPRPPVTPETEGARR
jgi:hypothetical protein